MDTMNIQECTAVSEKDLSTAVFDEQGALYTFRYQKLIKCPNIKGFVQIHPNTRYIANYAFSGCELNKILLPNSIKAIGHHAFHASSLEFIEIPDSVQIIGHDAFRWCENLQYVSLPSQLSELQKSTFQKCKCLKSLYIPESVLSIEGGCFSGCFNIDLRIANRDFKVIDDCLYQISTKALISCWSFKKHLCLAQGLLRIEDNAFAACKHFDSIIIPNTTKYIGKNLFGNYGISEIHIPKSVEFIDPFAFDRNVKKIHVQIGQSVRIKAMLPSTYHDIIYESDWK